MRRHDGLARRSGWRAGGRLARTIALALVLAAAAGCSSAAGPGRALSDPPQSLSPSPDYPGTCAPVGGDSSAVCLRIALQAIDAARSREALPPMRLPSDFGRLSVPEQLFVAVDRERVDRGLPPLAGLSTVLDRVAQRGAAAGGLPSTPGHVWESAANEWIGAVDNGLDALYQWMYQDGPDSGVPGCRVGRTSGCWADRGTLLAQMGTHGLAMGAAFAPNADAAPGDRGGSSLAATLAAGPPTAYDYTWRQAQAETAAGTLQPLRAVPSNEAPTGIVDPRHNIAPVPDFVRSCAGSIDVSASCMDAALAAINHAHVREGIRPMVLPAGFARLSVPEQLLVTIDLERVDRGLSVFGGLTAGLDQNAQRGADAANDPPDAGHAYLLVDGEWAGGSSNALDAVYGWMYDDGYNSGNLDCPRRGAPGCWGHRKGILDDFGSGPNLAMGAALALHADTNRGDVGGTSMAVTLAVADAPVSSYAYSWAQALAAMPPGGP